MNVAKERTLIFGFVILLSVVKNLNSASDYANPIEELGDFTLYNHGEIGKYNGYKGIDANKKTHGGVDELAFTHYSKSV